MLLFLHLIAAAFWLGGLMLLPIIVFAGLRSLEREPFQRLIRLTGRAFALGSILAWATLGITGLLLARQHLGSVANLSTTAFGQRLLVKVVLAAGALLTAVLHTVTGRAGSPVLLAVSRILALTTFLLTLGVFYEAARLSG
jgi:putative copper export protein